MRNLKLVLWSFVCLFLVALPINAQPKMTFDITKKGVAISPTHYGIFFEDINHAADGGLYAELIRNRSLEDGTTPLFWTSSNQSGAASTIAVDSVTTQLNEFQRKTLKLSVAQATATARAAVYNSGFWGINVVNGRQYTLTFFAKCDAGFTGTVTASLESSASAKYGQATISGLTTEWKKYSTTITVSGNDANARFVLSTNSAGTLWFDVVSLFPPTFKNRPNGLRPELTQLLADMKPKFFRFPGGCFVEGEFLADRFQWKNTIGDIEIRPGHYNRWGYRTSDGMGFHEFLQLSEDIGAIPLYVTNIGVAHQQFQPYTDLNWYIQDVLDALEYANGDVTTTWGAIRAINGHPAPFNIGYIEVGNENQWNDNYAKRYALFAAAIKAKYPNVKLISNGIYGVSPEIVDEHYYTSPEWFMSQYNKYDNFSRTSYKVYVGEYSANNGCGNGNLLAALGEAAFLCGLEKNSDVVTMNCYAPIFVNTNDRKWNPDIINYNSSVVYCTPSYYVQKLFANNLGNVSIPIKDSLIQQVGLINNKGYVGLGTWKTSVDYSDFMVKNKAGNTILTDNFSSVANFTTSGGTWTAAGNLLSQSVLTSDYRAINKTQIPDSTYTFTCKARKTGGNEGFNIIFGYKDNRNYYKWNLGGWTNTKHAIQQVLGGETLTLTSVAGSVDANVWYDIKIEVNKSQVSCYLNNVLIHSFTCAPTNLVYTAASLDEQSKQLFVKVVNTEAFDKNIALSFRGFTTGNIFGNATVLTSASVLDENSLTATTKVVPVTTTINATGTNLLYTFKANSVTILKINTDGANAVPTVTSEEKHPSVYPNPAKSVIYLNNAGYTLPVNLQVVSLTGQICINQPITSAGIDVSGFKPGVYIAKITQGSQSYSMKLIKE